MALYNAYGVVERMRDITRVYNINIYINSQLSMTMEITT